MVKYLIINADDFGLSPSVNLGIVKAYMAGIVSSTTVLVNMPAWKDAIRIARMYPGLGVGLHLNLTEGRAISAPASIPSLVDHTGMFHNQYDTWVEHDIEIELQAQWNQLRAAGLKPTHIDSHMHMHLIYPAVFRAVQRLAMRESRPIRYQAIRKHLPLEVPVRSTNELILDTYHEPQSSLRLIQHLQCLSNGVTELMCHPGEIDDILRQQSSWVQERQQELQHLLDPAIPAALRACDIQLIHYGQLPKGQQWYFPASM